MAKVRVPMNFGVENLKCPVHNNIDLLVANDEVVKANSLILSYNSTTFKDLFFRKLCTSVDVTKFTKSSVDHFVKCLYSGKVTIDNNDSFRALIELADTFSVDWFIEQCDSYYMMVTDSITFGDKYRYYNYGFEILKFSFDEASCAPKRCRQKYKLKVQEKISSMNNAEKQKFIQQYATKYVYLSVDQLNAMLELAQGHEGILLKIVQENIDSHNNHLDDKSFHILERIDLSNCLKSDADIETFNQLFGKTFVVRTEQDCDNIKTVLDLGISATQRVLSQKPFLASKIISIKRDVNVQMRGTSSSNSTCNSISYASTCSGSPTPIRNLISDGNIVDELQDPTSIPNLFNTLDVFRKYGRSIAVQDILDAASTSAQFKNLYMVIELFITYSNVKNCNDENSTRASLESIIEKLVEVKNRRGWKRVDPFFFPQWLNRESKDISDEYIKRYPGISLVILIRHCDSLVSMRDSVEIVCNRGRIQANSSRKYAFSPNTIRMGEFLSSDKQTSMKRIYKFYWKHPNITCSNSKQCGFIINMTPISGGKLDSFDIGLSTEASDYPDDIHFHPETMTAQKMHLILRRDYNKKSSGRCSENVYVSWSGKPVYHSNHVHWGGHSIDTYGYIALVVYYDVSDVDESILKQSELRLSMGEPFRRRTVVRSKLSRILSGGLN